MLRKMNSMVQLKKRRGMWDLISITIGIAAVAILVAIAIPRLSGYLEGKKVIATKLEMSVLAQQCVIYEYLTGNPPANLVTLTKELAADASIEGIKWDGFLSNVSKRIKDTEINDLWKKPYIYDDKARTITSNMGGIVPEGGTTSENSYSIEF